MTEKTAEQLADLYQVLGALMERWDELGITTEHMDALIDAQREWKDEDGKAPD